MRAFIKSLFSGGAASRFVEVLPRGATVEVRGAQTILEAALEQGLAFPHNCTVGTCGSCKSRLVEGQVDAVSDFGYTLSKTELDAGYILACQARPRLARTVLEIAPAASNLVQPESFQARVAATSALTHDILRVVVETDRPVRFVAGQYASLQADGLGRARHYSFAEAPQRTGRSTLAFFVRRVPGGEFTGALFSGALAGQPLVMTAPLGEFYLRPGDGPMLCIAGGSGLAPLLSVLEDMRLRRVRRPCKLLFGARTQADLYALDAIRSLSQSWLDRFEFVPVLSHEPAGSPWTGARGLVTQFIDGVAPETQGYLCGPPPMIDAAIARLVALGVPLPHIFYDKFTDGPGTAPAPAAAEPAHTP